MEFPFQNKGDESLDQRGKGTTCHVQVKGTASDKGNRVKLRLSAAEHLAKDPKPALVVVLLMAKDGALQGGQRLPMTFAELADAVPDIEAASRLLLDKPPSLTFDVPISLPVQSPAELDVLLVNRLSWAGQTLAYAATAKIRRRDESDVWGIESAEPRDIRLVPHDGFNEYVQARSAEYDMPNIISRGEDA